MDTKEQLTRFQAERLLRSQAKYFLTLLEDLKFTHEENFVKLRAVFSHDTEVINLADYFDQGQFGRYRKRILDNLNDSIRAIDNYFNK